MGVKVWKMRLNSHGADPSWADLNHLNQEQLRSQEKVERKIFIIFAFILGRLVLVMFCYEMRIVKC